MLRWYSISTFCSKALGWPNSSTITEWSITRLTGTSGLILLVSPPSLAMASRMAARSTTQGTPVKSCSRTRAGRYWISLLDSFGFFCQSATAWMSAVETVKPPSSKRSRFSSKTFIENGRRETSPSLAAAFFSE